MTGLKRFVFAAASAAIALGSASMSLAYDNYYYYSLEDRTVYTYYVYSDPEKTNLIDVTSGHCAGEGRYEFAAQPYVSTPYYDKQFSYICQGGAYLPPDGAY